MIRLNQGKSFKVELRYLKRKKKGKNEGRIPLFVDQFNLHLDEQNVLCCRSGIGNANVAYDNKVPILLPAKSKFSELTVRECHNKVMHNGTNDTLSGVREKFWIIRGRDIQVYDASFPRQNKESQRKCNGE